MILDDRERFNISEVFLIRFAFHDFIAEIERYDGSPKGDMADLPSEMQYVASKPPVGVRPEPVLGGSRIKINGLEAPGKKAYYDGAELPKCFIEQNLKDSEIDSLTWNIWS